MEEQVNDDSKVILDEKAMKFLRDSLFSWMENIPINVRLEQIVVEQKGANILSTINPNYRPLDTSDAAQNPIKEIYSDVLLAFYGKKFNSKAEMKLKYKSYDQLLKKSRLAAARARLNPNPKKDEPVEKPIDPQKRLLQLEKKRLAQKKRLCDPIQREIHLKRLRESQKKRLSDPIKREIHIQRVKVYQLNRKKLNPTKVPRKVLYDLEEKLKKSLNNYIDFLPENDTTRGYTIKERSKKLFNELVFKNREFQNIALTATLLNKLCTHAESLYKDKNNLLKIEEATSTVAKVQLEMQEKMKEQLKKTIALLPTNDLMRAFSIRERCKKMFYSLRASDTKYETIFLIEEFLNELYVYVEGLYSDEAKILKKWTDLHEDEKLSKLRPRVLLTRINLNMIIKDVTSADFDELSNDGVEQSNTLTEKKDDSDCQLLSTENIDQSEEIEEIIDCELPTEINNEADCSDNIVKVPEPIQTISDDEDAASDLDDLEITLKPKIDKSLYKHIKRRMLECDDFFAVISPFLINLTLYANCNFEGIQFPMN